jgi:hypothetical protein
MKPLFGGLDLLDFNNEFLNKHKYSLPHQLAGKFALCSIKFISFDFLLPMSFKRNWITTRATSAYRLNNVSLCFLGAAMMYFLEPCKQTEALSIATSLGEDMNKRSLQVGISPIIFRRFPSPQI